MKASDFNQGMTVYSRDDEELGQVHEVWAATHAQTFQPVLQSLLFGPSTGSDDLLAAGDGYLQVRRGSSYSPIGHDFYVPFAVVRQVDSFTSITLRVTAQACAHRFSTVVPDFHAAA